MKLTCTKCDNTADFSKQGEVTEYYFGHAEQSDVGEFKGFTFSLNMQRREVEIHCRSCGKISRVSHLY
ncbi:hypothetical protein QB910_000062 [Dabrowskivirus KKP3916]|uniref:Uncharacterized protein n=1 Tax=Alicyclobacillus phage KKP_3916 TaxID=3040651 RepID=A0AAT9V898_9CAUD|nr:hypothetical protein QB910_000062 [Alicyclobacillus phage KKP 3916]